MPYHHTILPLTPRNKETSALGIADFPGASGASGGDVVA